jgi:hypothetical protein
VVGCSTKQTQAWAQTDPVVSNAAALTQSPSTFQVIATPVRQRPHLPVQRRGLFQHRKPAQRYRHDTAVVQLHPQPVAQHGGLADARVRAGQIEAAPLRPVPPSARLNGSSSLARAFWAALASANAFASPCDDGELRRLRLPSGPARGVSTALSRAHTGYSGYCSCAGCLHIRCAAARLRRGGPGRRGRRPGRASAPVRAVDEAS